jgi:hypothetical protein
VITGEQIIRRARELLGWTRFKLSSRAGLHPAIVERAEKARGTRIPAPEQAIGDPILDAPLRILDRAALGARDGCSA